MKATVGELKRLLETAPDDTDISDLLPKIEVVKLVNSDIPSEMPVPDAATTNIRHSVNTGDLIAAMGCFKRFYELTGRKPVILQTINMQGQYYSGAVHPIVDEQGRQVTFNKYMYEMVKPLIESQEYIQKFEPYTGQRIDVDLDIIRSKTYVNLPHGPIQGWIPLAYPDLCFDISKPWIFLDENSPAHIKGQVAGKIIINFTERYRTKIDYYFLQAYAADLIFAGTDQEHANFCNQWQISIPRLQINNFLELAYALKGCRFLLANQSMNWGLAQALGVKRILEMCTFADNCFPGIGEDSYGYFYQTPAEYYFRLLYGKTK